MLQKQIFPWSFHFPSLLQQGRSEPLMAGAWLLFEGKGICKCDRWREIGTCLGRRLKETLTHKHSCTVVGLKVKHPGREGC